MDENKPTQPKENTSINIAQTPDDINQLKVETNILKEDNNKVSVDNFFQNSNFSEILGKSMTLYSNTMNEIFSETSKKAEELCKAMVYSFSLNQEQLRKNIQKLTIPTLESFNKFGQTIAPQFDQLNKRLSELGESFKKLDINLETYINRVNPILRSHFWFTTPSMDFRLWNYITQEIDKQTDQKYFLDKTFVDYFSSNDFRNLDYMIKDWNHNHLLANRLNIINSCVSNLKYSTCMVSNSNNPHFLIIPTLIAQIDGLMTDYLVEKGYTFVKTRCIRPTDNKSGSKYDFYDESLSEFIGNNFDKDSVYEKFFKVESFAAKELLMDHLFQDAYPTKNDNVKDPFSRNKIMHGEDLNYGNMENTLRLFLLIDFLADSMEEDLQNNPP